MTAIRTSEPFISTSTDSPAYRLLDVLWVVHALHVPHRANNGDLRSLNNSGDQKPVRHGICGCCKRLNRS
jgi:hypothetical protein